MMHFQMLFIFIKKSSNFSNIEKHKEKSYVKIIQRLWNSLSLKEYKENLKKLQVWINIRNIYKARKLFL